MMETMKVRNMVGNSGREVPNQFNIYNGRYEIFQSYRSTIAVVDYNSRSIEIGADYNYSRTTGKYRNQFFDSLNMPELATLKGLETALKEGKYKDWIVTYIR